ncbi:MAG TPA: ABC transporter permease, partial [Spirochaetes bacterium]|nr:ABC transporter permease [Spirochaetota bacterium]
MKVLMNQVLIEMKLFYREPISVFWTFVFPAVLMIMIGWFFEGNVTQTKLYVFDEDQSNKSSQLIDLLKEASELKVKVLERKEFESKKKDNRGELILFIHKGFQEKINSKQTGELTFYHNLAYGRSGESGIAVFYQLLPSLVSKLTRYSVPLNIQKVNLGEKGKLLRYIDFLCPGIIAMSVMSTSLFGVGIAITSYREKGQLRRFALTPLRKPVFILAHIIHRYFVVLLQALSLILLAYMFFDLRFYGSIFSFLIVITVGLVTFISMGFMVASRARKSETAAAIANLLFFPMLLLGGVYFPLDNIPEVFRPAVKLLPLANLTETLRQVIFYGQPFYQLTDEILAQLAVMLVCFAVSVKAFR